jgi:hypothetical protein
VVHRRTALDCFQTVIIVEGPEEVVFTPYRTFSSTSMHVDSSTPHPSGVDIVDRETKERFLIHHELNTVWTYFDRLTFFYSSQKFDGTGEDQARVEDPLWRAA